MKKKQLKHYIKTLEKSHDELGNIVIQLDKYIEELQARLRMAETELAATKVTREVWGE